MTRLQAGKMRWRQAMIQAFGRGLGLVCVILALGQPAGSEAVTNDESDMIVLGAVQVDDTSLGLLISYSDDAALLELAISAGDDPAKYVPLFASTYRGIPSVTLDVFVSKTKDAIWVTSSWPDSPVLVYHRLGTDTAITPFGEMAVLDSPMPQVLSGGPMPFPDAGPAVATKVASFYYQAGE
jgi:hypothetical protein